MNTNILTKELLEKTLACKQAIKFCENNNLFDIDLNKTKFTGDYMGYVDWLKNHIIKAKLTFDSNDNLIQRVDIKLYLSMIVIII